MSDLQIRPSVPGDLDDLVRIYNHYVTSSHVTFEQVGHKFDRFWDVRWYEKDLSGSHGFP